MATYGVKAREAVTYGTSDKRTIMRPCGTLVFSSYTLANDACRALSELSETVQARVVVRTRLGWVEPWELKDIVDDMQDTLTEIEHDSPSSRAS